MKKGNRRPLLSDLSSDQQLSPYLELAKLLAEKVTRAYRMRKPPSSSRIHQWAKQLRQIITSLGNPHETAQAIIWYVDSLGKAKYLPDCRSPSGIKRKLAAIINIWKSNGSPMPSGFCYFHQLPATKQKHVLKIMSSYRPKFTIPSHEFNDLVRTVRKNHALDDPAVVRLLAYDETILDVYGQNPPITVRRVDEGFRRLISQHCESRQCDAASKERIKQQLTEYGFQFLE